MSRQMPLFPAHELPIPPGMKPQGERCELRPLHWRLSVRPLQALPPHHPLAHHRAQVLGLLDRLALVGLYEFNREVLASDEVMQALVDLPPGAGLGRKSRALRPIEAAWEAALQAARQESIDRDEQGWVAWLTLMQATGVLVWRQRILASHRPGSQQHPDRHPAAIREVLREILQAPLLRLTRLDASLAQRISAGLQLHPAPVSTRDAQRLAAWVSARCLALGALQARWLEILPRPEGPR